MKGTWASEFNKYIIAVSQTKYLYKQQVLFLVSWSVPYGSHHWKLVLNKIHSTVKQSNIILCSKSLLLRNLTHQRVQFHIASLCKDSERSLHVFWLCLDSDTEKRLFLHYRIIAIINNREWLLSINSVTVMVKKYFDSAYPGQTLSDPSFIEWCHFYHLVCHWDNNESYHYQR